MSSTTTAMPTSHGQPSARKRSGGTLVTMVTTRPMNQGTALSDSATRSSTTNKAANSHFAWRAKCHRKAISAAGGSGRSGVAVGFRNRSKSANIFGWLQAWRGGRQSTVEPAGERNRCGSVAAVLTFSPGIMHVIVRSRKDKGQGENVHAQTYVRAGADRELVRRRRRAGPDLSVAADHHAGGLPARRSDRRAGAASGRRDGTHARPGHRGRDGERRLGHDCLRPRG